MTFYGPNAPQDIQEVQGPSTRDAKNAASITRSRLVVATGALGLKPT